jgi:hypothetical protein
MKNGALSALTFFFQCASAFKFFAVDGSPINVGKSDNTSEFAFYNSGDTLQHSDATIDKR